jgi:uncharacterized membrane protein
MAYFSVLSIRRSWRALFGFFAYATYRLTNLAPLKNWAIDASPLASAFVKSLLHEVRRHLANDFRRAGS